MHHEHTPACLLALFFFLRLCAVNVFDIAEACGPTPPYDQMVDVIKR